MVKRGIYTMERASGGREIKETARGMAPITRAIMMTGSARFGNWWTVKPNEDLETKIKSVKEFSFID